MIRVRLYNLSLKVLKDSNITKQFESLIEKGTSIEQEIVKSDKLLSRLPIFIGIIFGIAVILSIARIIEEGVYLVNIGPATITEVVYNAICKLFICIGFIIYGRKLLKILPIEYFQRINYVSYFISIFVYNCNF